MTNILFNNGSQDRNKKSLINTLLHDLSSPYDFFTLIRDNKSKHKCIVFCIWENSLIVKNKESINFKNLETVNNNKVIDLIKNVLDLEKCLGVYLISHRGIEDIKSFEREVRSINLYDKINLEKIRKELPPLKKNKYNRMGPLITLSCDTMILKVIKDVCYEDGVNLFFNDLDIFVLIGDIRHVAEINLIDDDIFRQSLEIYYLPNDEEKKVLIKYKDKVDTELEELLGKSTKILQPFKD